MSKHNKHNSGKGSPNHRSSSSAIPAANELKPAAKPVNLEVEAVVHEARSGAASAGATVKVAMPVDADEWPELRREMFAAKESFDAASKALEKQQEALNVREEELRSAGEAAANRDQKLKEGEAELQEHRVKMAKELDDGKRDLLRELQLLGEQRAEAAKRDAALQASELQVQIRREDMLAKEAEASAGFLALRTKLLEPLEAEIAKLRAEYAHLTKTAHEKLLRQDQELRQEKNAMLEQEREERKTRSDALDADLKARFTKREQAVDSRERSLEQRLATFERAMAQHDVNERDLESEITRRVRVAAELITRDLADERARSQVIDDERKEFRDKLTAMETLQRKLGDDPASVLRKLREIEKENKELKHKLDDRPAADLATRFEALRDKNNELERRNHDLAERNASLENQATLVRIQVGERENLVRERKTLELHVKALELRTQALGREVAEAKSDAETRSPFPLCTKMDLDEAQPADLDENPIQLNEFANQIRMAMAGSVNPRYYSERHVRCFVAGLASSQLILLEGISGTGKTSLPRAFARAIAGKGEGEEICAEKAAPIIEVQAGWRDRHDLLGHFNSFDKKFDEQPFTQAVYRASCPSQRDRPVLVVLDEMNLSHPEQYFADLLSKLEAGANPNLELVTTEVANAPRLLVERRKLPLPDNVWFVGTANMDETTKDFADKTYDRAHVMELPRQPSSFVGRLYDRKLPISHHLLRQAFQSATGDSHPKLKKFLDLLEKRLGGLLATEFQIGWGNRLERYVSNFIPVYTASGGSLGEAVDHVIATKILRRIRNRHDLDKEPLARLDEEVRTILKELDEKWATKPLESASLALIFRERKRLDSSFRSEFS